MDTKLFFLISSLALIVLTIVTMCTAPNINGVMEDLDPRENCQKDVDEYDYKKEQYKDPTDSQQQELDYLKQDINLCKRRKAVYGLEFSSLIIDIVLGSVCCLLGLLHYFDVGKVFLKITGIIGLATGVIGLILTVFYLGYSSYIFNNDYSGETKLYDDGAILQIVDGKYAYNYNEDDAQENQYYKKAKFKDLGKKAYNYDSKRYKDSLESTDTSSIRHCSLIDDNSEEQTYDDDGDPDTPPVPVPSAYHPSSYYKGQAKVGECESIWTVGYATKYGYENKYLYDRWLTSIILSAFICLCNIGVAIFGLLIFLNGDSGHSPL
jgi:hypothetical protein